MKHTNTCWHDSNGLVQKHIGTAYDKIKLVADNLDMLQELVDSTEGIQLIFLLTNKSQLDKLNTDYFRVARMYDTDNYGYYDDYMFDLEFDEYGEPKRDEEGKLLGTWNTLGSVFKDTYEDVTNEAITFQKDKVVDVNVLKAVKIIGAKATSEEFGTVKIFATLGDSEEGTITQKALTDIITIIQKDAKHAVDTAENALHKAELALDSTVRGFVSDEQGNEVNKANSQRLTNELIDNAIGAIKHSDLNDLNTGSAHIAEAILDKSGKTQQQFNDGVVTKSDLTQTIIADKLKAPSNFAVDVALKKQDPRNWGVGLPNNMRQSTDKFEDPIKKPSGFYSWGEDGAVAYGAGLHIRDAIKVVFGVTAPLVRVFNFYDENATQTYDLYHTANTTADPNGVLTTKQGTVTLATKDLATETGNSHSKVMTQKATTDAINNAVIKNTASTAENGWYKDTSTGIITQWGLIKDVPSVNGYVSKDGKEVAFPITFPNKVFSIQVTSESPRLTVDQDYGVASVNNSKFKVGVRYLEAGKLFFIAIGH